MEPNMANTFGSSIPKDIHIRAPSKYPGVANNNYNPPPRAWLYNTWTVTHSTLKMWRSARNVRITYGPIGDNDSDRGQLSDLVEYEKKTDKSPLKNVKGIDTPDSVIPGAYNWRGRGWLKFVSSHWEILGYGERTLPAPAGSDAEAQTESWVVTWFAPTLFTAEGIDIYSNRRSGLSAETHKEIMDALLAVENAPKFVDLVRKDMLPVDIRLPWSEATA